MKIDIYTHIAPKKYRDKLGECIVDKKRIPLMDRVLVNLDDRFRVMDRFEDLAQVLVPPSPALESMVDARDAVELARIHNDGMAELVQKYPDRFPTAVAVLPLSDIEASLKELDRAITELRLRGILLHTPVRCLTRDKVEQMITKPLDSPEFMPIYERMVHYNLPIWIHPFPSHQDPFEEGAGRSGYRIWQIFGWPFETTVTMVRLIFNGIFEKYPDIKFITHHGGAMVPFFKKRIAIKYRVGEIIEGERYTDGLTRRPLEYFRMFYADTAIDGSTSGLMCTYNFYGAKHILFGTDAPWDHQMGYMLTKNVIESIERMPISVEEKQAIFEGNATELLRLP